MKNIKSWLLQIVLPLGLCLATCFVCSKLYLLVGDALFSGLNCPEGKVSFENAHYVARAKFPASVSNIDSFRPGGALKYCHEYLRFEIDATDLNSFVASTRIKLPLIPKPNVSGSFLPHENKDWMLDSTHTYLSGGGPHSLDYTQNILVDTTNPKRYVVFMHVEHEYLE
jgi:hypothetical protein